MSFAEAWELTDTIPGSFTRTSGEAFYAAAEGCVGTFVELGVDQGRSASLLLALAQDDTARCVVLVDSWESVLVENKAKVYQLLQHFPNAQCCILHATSAQAAQDFSMPIAFLHIDANHYESDGVYQDCALWLPKMRPGAIACFHDYDSSFPAVKVAVDEHAAGWEVVGNFDGLAIRRKP